MPESSPVPALDDPTTLVELVNRVVDRGVVLTGEVTISVADVDLLYLCIDLLLCSVDRLELDGSGSGARSPAPEKEQRP